MHYKITIENTTLTIETETDPSEKKILLEEFAKCAAGTCSCPSQQYEKLQSIKVLPTKSGINIKLVPQAGVPIDEEDIRNCLEYTAKIVDEKTI